MSGSSEGKIAIGDCTTLILFLCRLGIGGKVIVKSSSCSQKELNFKAMTESEIHKLPALLLLTGNFEVLYEQFVKEIKEDRGLG